MSLHVGLSQSQPLAGIMALSGYLLLPDQIDRFKAAALNTPIFMAHGINDPVVSLALGDGSRRKLLDAGCTIEWHSYPMQHSVCPEEIRQIGKWVSSLLV